MTNQENYKIKQEGDVAIVSSRSGKSTKMKIELFSASIFDQLQDYANWRKSAEGQQKLQEISKQFGIAL